MRRHRHRAVRRREHVDRRPDRAQQVADVVTIDGAKRLVEMGQRRS